jgi:hypothetical protein
MNNFAPQTPPESHSTIGYAIRQDNAARPAPFREGLLSPPTKTQPTATSNLTFLNRHRPGIADLINICGSLWLFSSFR